MGEGFLVTNHLWFSVVFFSLWTYGYSSFRMINEFGKGVFADGFQVDFLPLEMASSVTREGQRSNRVISSRCNFTMQMLSLLSFHTWNSSHCSFFPVACVYSLMDFKCCFLYNLPIFQRSYVTFSTRSTHFFLFLHVRNKKGNDVGCYIEKETMIVPYKHIN